MGWGGFVNAKSHYKQGLRQQMRVSCNVLSPMTKTLIVVRAF
jgi:hypothetical protein